jgi:hypothetical protein
VPTYYDDNFGHWKDSDDPDTVASYFQVQEKSVNKTCRGCKRTVRLLQMYDYCHSCVDKGLHWHWREHGAT